MWVLKGSTREASLDFSLYASDTSGGGAFHLGRLHIYGSGPWADKDINDIWLGSVTSPPPKKIFFFYGICYLSKVKYKNTPLTLDNGYAKIENINLQKLTLDLTWVLEGPA